jgi:hypothetical protein
MSSKNKFLIEGAKYREAASASGGFGYSVEARYNYPEPKECCGKIFDNRWAEIPIVESKVGVPEPRQDVGLMATRLYTYAQAQALRWWFVSIASLDGGFCWETRLVKHKIEYSYSALPVEYVEPMDRRGDVPEDMCKGEKDD